MRSPPAFSDESRGAWQKRSRAADPGERTPFQKLLHDKLRRPPVRVRRPVRPHVGTDQAARGTHHARAQRSQSHIVRQPIGIHDGAVIAPARAAVNEKIAAAVAADVFKRDGLECLGLPPRHGAKKSGCAARSGSIGTGSIKVASSASARELFTRFDTGQRCSTSSAAGLSNSVPADPVSHGSSVRQLSAQQFFLQRIAVGRNIDVRVL
jgi:hypothetical protein